VTQYFSDDAIRAGVRAFQSGHNGFDDLSDWRAFLQAALAAAPSPQAQAQPYVSDEQSKGEYALAALPPIAQARTVDQVFGDCVQAAHALPQQGLTDERIDQVSAIARDALLDFIYENGTASEGVRPLVRGIARAIERELRASTAAAPSPVPAGFKLLQDTTHAQRSWPEDASHENGNYSCCCCHCLRMFTANKRRVVCKVCAAAPGAPTPAPKGTE
jgi:hypothetical protein